MVSFIEKVETNWEQNSIIYTFWKNHTQYLEWMENQVRIKSFIKKEEKTYKHRELRENLCGLCG